MSTSRRDFLKLSALAGGGLLMQGWLPAQAASDTGSEVGYFVRILPSNTLEFWLTHHEMGQGVGTGMAMIFAQELGADMAQIRVLPVPDTADTRYVLSGTGGSNCIKDNYLHLRRGAALARAALLSAAAKRWRCAPEQCRTARGFVTGPQARQRLAFGALAADAAALGSPANRDEFRKLQPTLSERVSGDVVGKQQVNVFADAIVRGKQNYGIDFSVPGMLFASLERAPQLRGRVLRFDPSAALKVPGVRAVVKIEAHEEPTNNLAAPALFFSSKESVAVIATSTWAAMQGRKALVVEWEKPAGVLHSNASWEAHAAQALDRELAVVKETGSAPADRANVLAAEYVYPFQAHACMEPMNCVAHHKGSRAEVWVGTQGAIGWRNQLAKIFKLPESEVVVTPQFSGGAFGRRFYMDTAIEALRVSAAAGNVPVKVVWTREDDLRHDHYHPYSQSRLRAALNPDGSLASYEHDEARAYFGNPRGEHPWFVYDSPHVRYAFASLQGASPLQGGAWRSVVANHWAFGQECFIDELAQAARKDPVQFRLDLMRSGEDKPSGDRYKVSQARMRKVVEKAAELSGWGKLLPSEPGVQRGRGFAAYPYMHGNSYCAMVADVEVRGGQLSITRVVAVVDCGLVINPDGARQQVEGGIMWGLSAALHGGVRLADGAVTNTNFHDTPFCRNGETPHRIEVHFVEEPGAAPTGLGEIAPPLIAPALCNALFAATGKRIRRLPLEL
ncbi:xanthine dehydrogenase family protein molybdopterin-binding subunit [Massilia endophytica]|uniref:xanthine dehydrogenase family protein molybdopterin-binding subunit n=1 Tax=Massilia endophytica TaxID=2899220 RepID=UPI001E4A0833|nr:molybdopterin cofactor-binding domain-containing protein [Massilia endophytica]UGQ45842.1 molybdopterin-dependent oxidoreductase [Massilia endophytica]